MRKNFIITVDTEGDNLWSSHPGEIVTTNNAKYIPRFQELCEKYLFYPVYLLNYEMLLDSFLVNYIKGKAQLNKCEIGMHIHAWNSPPEHSILQLYGNNSFITEYPPEIQKRKLKYLKDLIKYKTGFDPVSFRSGRWATDQKLFKILDEIDIMVDCSITPGINHFSDKGMSDFRGNNYVHESMCTHRLNGKLIEVPMSTARLRTYHGLSIKNRIKNIIIGKNIWLRPATNTTEEMLRLINYINKLGINHLEFMIHSSELMPGGSPYTMCELDVEHFYKRVEEVFSYVNNATDYRGITLTDYYQNYEQINKNDLHA